MKSSRSEENYIKGIYRISGEEFGWVNTNDLAARMEIKPSSATDMIKKLHQKKLVEYQKYNGVKLTSKGNKLALKVIRKHRLWEVFLKEKLGFEWDEVHDIAEQLEHISSPELVERLDKFLQFPKFDPHGDPIPDQNGKIRNLKRALMSDFQPGESGKIVGVNDSSTAFLKFLDSKGVGLGSKIEIIQVHEFDHSMDILIEGSKNTINLSKEVTTNLFINNDE